MSDSQNTSIKPEDLQPPNCNCVQDPFADLPPDLQPEKKSWKTGFRQVTCPDCGLEFWTNTPSNRCLDCRKPDQRGSQP